MRNESREATSGNAADRIETNLQTPGTSSLDSENGRLLAAHFRIALWVLATFQFFYLLTSTGRVRSPDEYNTLYTTESLVLRGSMAVPQAVQLHNFYGRYDVHGAPRAAYPPGQAALCAPWYAFGQYVLARLPGVPAEDTDLVVAFSSCLSSATFAALTVAFFFLLLCGIGVGVRPALLAAAMVGVGTPVFAYSAWLFSEPLSAAIFLGVALYLFGLSREPVGLRAAALAGLVLGFATWVRPTNVLAVGMFAIAVIVRDGKAALRSAAVLCSGSAIGVGALLAHNALLFGSPFELGYPAAAEGGKRLNTFNTPMLTGLYGFLLSPGKSVFLFAPPLILALAGLRRLWKQERGVAMLAILFFGIYLLFYAHYTQWEGGYCVGPRYLVPSIVLVCLGLGPVLAEGKPWVKKVALVLVVAGALVQGVSLATSFMEDQVPSGRYYDANWNYRLDYSLRGQWLLLERYFADPQPARLGLGWDRWFVFLHKGGLATGTLAALGLVMAAGFAVSVAGLRRGVRGASDRDSVARL